MDNNYIDVIIIIYRVIIVVRVNLIVTIVHGMRGDGDSVVSNVSVGKVNEVNFSRIDVVESSILMGSVSVDQDIYVQRNSINLIGETVDVICIV